MDELERLAEMVVSLTGLIARFEQVYSGFVYTKALFDASWREGYSTALSDFPRRRPSRRRHQGGPDLRVVR